MDAPAVAAEVGEGAGAGALRPNGHTRPSSQLFVDQEGRKPLFASSNASASAAAGAGAGSNANIALSTKNHDHNKNTHKSSSHSSNVSESEPRSRIKSEIPRYRPPAATSSNRRNNSEAQIPLALRHDSSNASVASAGSPVNSRIPKPTTTFSPRRPMSLAEAYKMAEEEEYRGLANADDDDDDDDHQLVEASPSPAPRTWRAKRDIEGQNNLRKEMSDDPLETRSKARNSAKETGESAKSWRDKTDWRRRPQTGSEWFKELGSQPQDGGPVGGVGGGSAIPDLVPGIEDMPLPSIEGDEQGNGGVPSWRQGSGPKQDAPPSPEKSYAWQVDEDFTAGDLQVSDSPRIKVNNTNNNNNRPFANRLPFDENSDIDIHSRTRVNNPGSQNTKLDEIRSREVKTGNNIPIDRPLSRNRNTKLDEIRAREVEAEKDIPIPDRRLRTSSNTKIDEIRQREADGLTKRQLAAIRLEEIREQNAMTRSKSPEERRQLEGGANQEQALKTETASPSKSSWETGGERIPDTPVTIYKSRRDLKTGPSIDSVAAPEDAQKKENMAPSRPGALHRRADSKDVLRQLARAASSSPGGDAQPTRKTQDAGTSSTRNERRSTDRPSVNPRGGPRRALTTNNVASARRTNNNNNNGGKGGRNGNARPTVGFAGLRRVKSSESSGSKRSSVHSEMGSTDRIEAEMKLFAPTDNHSERGSVRAPSPPALDSDEEDEEKQGSNKRPDEDEAESALEATPRATKPDPRFMPTPKVTGAYVETPVTTVKVKSFDSQGVRKMTLDDPLPAGSGTLAKLREREGSRNKNGRDRDTASEPGEDEKPNSMTNSTQEKRPRARSLPRRRPPPLPPLKNSAKIPTVKDDLQEIYRTYDIEDSTLDDLEQILAGRKQPNFKMKALSDKLASDPADEESFDMKLERMSQGLIDDAAPIDIDIKKEDDASKPLPEPLPGLGLELELEPESEPSPQAKLAHYKRMDSKVCSALISTRDVRKGIEALDDDINHDNQLRSEWKKREQEQEEQKKQLDKKIKQEGAGEKIEALGQELKPSVAKKNTSKVKTPILKPSSDAITYLYIPIPRLYTRQPRFQLTMLGLLALLAALWYGLESGTCALYCQPTVCTTTPCVWSYDDPMFGTALPVKLDQWTTGGIGRDLVNFAAEEAHDWIADMVDAARGRDILDVDVESLSFEGRRTYRRRLRKKGLYERAKKAEEDAPPEVRARWDAWHRERVARDQAKVMGYGRVRVEDDESIGGDEWVG